MTDMCSAAPANSSEAASAVVRGKVPTRAEYVAPQEDGGGAGGSQRRLARIIPHGPDACIDSGKASGYLNNPAVMAAIHVKDPGFCWAVCNTAPGWTYTVRSGPACMYVCTYVCNWSCLSSSFDDGSSLDPMNVWLAPLKDQPLSLSLSLSLCGAGRVCACVCVCVCESECVYVCVP